MIVKIDTKAYFRVLRVITPSLYANMAEELREQILQNMSTSPGNVILALDDVAEAEEQVVETLTKIQEVAEKKKVSFVITGAQAQLAPVFRRRAAKKQLNFTPVLSEAMDLVMMEQLERDLSGEAG